MTVTINGTTGIAGVDGSAATPAVQGADTNTGIFFPAADTIAFTEGGTEVMRIASSGRLGIGTTTPTEPLSVVGQISTSGAVGGFLLKDRATSASSSQWYSPSAGNTRLFDTVAAADRVIIDSSGNLSFNSGYGSAATAYGCRAWVNFNGTGTVAIRGSGNVTSITDNGTGNYTVNFTTAIVDTNYSATYTVSLSAGAGFGETSNSGLATTTAVFRSINTSAALVDATIACASYFR
jgi:hypothetical protein